MKGLLRTLAILASLMLAVQTIRHTYVLWFAPRTSVLEQYDKPLAKSIDSAQSLDELVQRYDPIRKEADRIRAERKRNAGDAPFPNPRFTPFDDNEEPFKSEQQLHEAIVMWEVRAHTISSLRYYWAIGFVFALAGLLLHGRNRWTGITLAIIGLAEMIYWTTPEYLGALTGAGAEFDRLIVYKMTLSIVAIAMLILAIWRFRVFAEDRVAGAPP